MNLKFCQECGKPVEANAAFCTHCGTKADLPQETHAPTEEPLPQAQQIVPPTQPPQMNHHQEQTNEPTATRSKQPIGKGKKILFSLIALLILALVGTHFYLTNHFDPMKKIEAMNEAYNKKDHAAFYGAFTVPDGVISDADRFYETVQDLGWPELRSDLSSQVNNLQENMLMDPISYAGVDFIRLDKKPILFGLYNDVSFTLMPLKTTVEVPFKDMKLTIAGITVTSTQDQEVIEIGDVIPGTYDWSFELAQHHMTMKNAGTTRLNIEEGNQAVFSPEWGFESVSIYTEVDAAVLHVNGKSTKEKVEGHAELYPVILDDKTEIQLVSKNAQGKEVKSPKYKLDSTSIDVSFEHIEQEKVAEKKHGEIEEVFHNFRNDYELAITTLDFSYISQYFKDNSKIQKDYRKFVLGHKDIAGYHYDFRTNDITDIKQRKDGKYEVKSFETFYYSSFEEGEIYYERTKKYVISEQDGRYYIESIENLTTDKQKQ